MYSGGVFRHVKKVWQRRRKLERVHEREAVNLSLFDRAAWIIIQTSLLVSRPVKGRAGYHLKSYPPSRIVLPISRGFVLPSVFFYLTDPFS